MPQTLEVIGLSKNFGQLQAVKDITFAAKSGEIIALLGPNGAGKSTLMNMIAGYLAPSSGTIKIMNQDIISHPLDAKTHIGFLPEGSPLYPDLSVKTFLNYMAELRGYEGFTKRAYLEQIASQAKIENVWEQKIETLSKGYLRRVGFAQSLLGNPEILMLDEPTDGLDPNQKEHIRNLIRTLSKHKTILISTHLLEEAENLANRIILINKGSIAAEGILEEILQKSGTTRLEQAFKKLTGGEQN